MIEEYFVPEERKKKQKDAQDKVEDQDAINKRLREQQEFEHQLEDNIESFMQMTGTLIDNHIELQS